MNDKCYMCDYYDEIERDGDVFPICTKTHDKEYPKFCDEKDEE